MLGKLVEKSPYRESAPTIIVKNKYEKPPPPPPPPSNVMPVFSFKLNALPLGNSDKRRKKMVGGACWKTFLLHSLWIREKFQPFSWLAHHHRRQWVVRKMEPGVNQPCKKCTSKYQHLPDHGLSPFLLSSVQRKDIFTSTQVQPTHHGQSRDGAIFRAA